MKSILGQNRPALLLLASLLHPPRGVAGVSLLGGVRDGLDLLLVASSSAAGVGPPSKFRREVEVVEVVTERGGTIALMSFGETRASRREKVLGGSEEHVLGDGEHNDVVMALAMRAEVNSMSITRPGPGRGPPRTVAEVVEQHLARHHVGRQLCALLLLASHLHPPRGVAGVSPLGGVRDGLDLLLVASSSAAGVGPPSKFSRGRDSRGRHGTRWYNRAHELRGGKGKGT